MRIIGRPGPLALVGSGEYLPEMEETDAALLEMVGGAASARVVILATASGLEPPESPARWTRLGLDHFARLGARVEVVPILRREDALDPRWLPPLEAANFFYFSGGDPGHVVATLRDSPAWEAIRARHLAGAALAGCSAGAMAICGLTARVRALAGGEDAQWQPALGLLPRLIVLPHFDRIAGFIGTERLQRAVRAVPDGSTLLGVDEETALVRVATGDGPGSPDRWQVFGRQGVSLFVAGEEDPRRLAAGQHVDLASS